MPKKDLSNRILEIDLLRGLCVLLMIFDHFMYDFWGVLPSVIKEYPYKRDGWREMFLTSRRYWNWDVRVVTRYVVIFFFLVLTGICCSFSKSNLKRGAKLGIVALGLTAATWVIGYVTNDVDMTIAFGVLHCIALTLILVGLLEKLTANKWVYLGIGLAMTAFGGHLYFQAERLYYGSENIIAIVAKSMVGLAKCGSDCFPLLFFGGQVFLGVFLGKLLYAKRKSVFGWRYHNNPLTFIGRNSLVIYVAHQVIIPVILGVIMLCCGYTLAL